MKKRMSKHLAFAIAICSVASNVYAVNDGFYLGFMAGPAIAEGLPQLALIEGSSNRSTTVVKPEKQHFGGRFFLGYKFLQFLGIEGGLTYFSNVRYASPSGISIEGSPTAQISTLDIMGKADLNVYNIGLFGKAGMAFLYQRTPGLVDTKDNTNTTAFSIKQPSFSQLRPAYAIGASYDITQNWVVDVSWNRYLPRGVVKSIDFYALGISYHFVDVYCGQFLCS